MLTASMGYDLHPQNEHGRPSQHEERHMYAHASPVGTDLALCCGSRHVRVLVLPYFCGERALRQEWDDAFSGHPGDEVVVWLPWDDQH